jgi:energy-coupling factor transporter ATP-binding protein EcfA2
MNTYTPRMRIVALSGTGVLSFDQLRLDLRERVTFIVGPNGSGKSNLTRLVTICQRAIESADGGPGDVDRFLAGFLAARHVGSRSPGIEARVAIRLTDAVERELVTEFIRALVTGALTGHGQPENMAKLDAWAETEITEAKLAPLMKGEIVTRHPGTPDGQWQCIYEFTVPGHDGAQHRYQWVLLGRRSGAIVDADAPDTIQGSDIATRITGSVSPPPGPEIAVPDGFQLLDLLPMRDLATLDCTFDPSGMASAALRRFAQMTGLPLITSRRRVHLATALRVIFRRALVHTSDTRLLPAGGTSWSSSELALRAGAEARLPELLLTLKNGDPAERARYRRIRKLFTDFTQGRCCEVRLSPVQQPTQNGQGTPPVPVPGIWVTVSPSDDPTGVQPEVPIEFAGAGAWEALVLAAVLGEPSASVAMLDEPAVALHPSLQRQLGAHLLDAPAQFLIITHSAELLPLTDTTDVRLIRLDRDDTNATRAWPLDQTCRAAMTRKLVSKGNERLPFAWRAVLCEGQDDVLAIMTLTERMGIDLRRRNIAVADCGGRDNMADYIWFCSELGLRYLAVMDADAGNSAAAPKAQAVRDAVSHRSGGELTEFPVTLETTFGVAKQNPSLVPSVIRALPFIGDMPDPAQTPPEVGMLAEAIMRLTK